MSTEPRTAAGRTVLAGLHPHGGLPVCGRCGEVLTPIIEAEAAEPAPLDALRRFAEYVAAMNPTSGQLTFAIRVDLQKRALTALAAGDKGSDR